MKNKTYGKLGYFIVALGALFYCYEYLLRVAPSVMRPELMQTFHIDATLFGTLGAFYYYAYTPMQTVVGVMVDKFKIRNVLTFAIICCVLGSFMMARTGSYNVAAFGRFMQGLGSAFAFVGALKLAATRLPADRFAFFSGATATLGFLGAAFGEIFLTHLVDATGWQYTLEIFSLIGLILACLVWLVLSIKCPSTITQESNYEVLTIKEALKQLLIIAKNRYIWIAGLLSFLMYLPTDVFAGLWGIPYLEKLHNYDPKQAALVSAMIFIGWAIGAPTQGYISDRYQHRLRVIVIGSILAATLSVIILYTPQMPYIFLCLLCILFGACSSVQLLTFAMARDVVSSKIAGMTIAFVNTLAMIGGFFFQRGVGQILDWTWTGEMQDGHRVYSVQSYEHAIAIVPVVLFLAFIIALLAKEKRPESILRTFSIDGNKS